MRTKIAMFSPKPSATYFYQGLPLSLLAISSMLPQKDYEIKIIKARAGCDYKQEVLDSAKGALALCISCLTGYPINETLEISKSVKEKYPEVAVILGGWHPSIMPKEILESPYVDIVCRGQGERTLYETVEKLKNKESLKGVLGISYKDNGKIVENKDRPFEEVDNFPPLPYDLIEAEKYIMKTELGSRTINLITSQGCPHRCGFCVEPLIYKRKWSAISAERVADDIEYFYRKHGIDSVFFNDSNFFVDENRVRKICEEIERRKISIKWGMANGRTKQLLMYGAATWELMAKTGCRSILVGAESGSQEMLDLIKKDTSVDDTVQIARICKNHGITVYFSFMVGLPSEQTGNDPEDMIKNELNETLNVIDKIYSVDMHHVIYLFLYTPYPGTPLYELSIRNGFKPPRNLEEWSRFELNFRNTPWVPEKYAKFVAYLQNYIFYSMSGLNYDKIINRYGGSKKIIFGSFAKILQAVAMLRWKTRFFGLPLDYKIVEFLSKKAF